MMLRTLLLSCCACCRGPRPRPDAPTRRRPSPSARPTPASRRWPRPSPAPTTRPPPSSRRWPTTPSRSPATRSSSCKDDKGFDPVTGAELPLPADAEDVINNNRMRGELDTALAALKLFSKDDKLRARGRQDAAQGDADEVAPAADRKGLGRRDRTQPSRTQLEHGARRHAAGQQRQGQAPGSRRAAGAAATSPTPRPLLIERLHGGGRPRGQGAAAGLAAQGRGRAGLGRQARRDVHAASAWARILLLVALGLAITYGLMGVINMAHGELMMIGAYATYVVQGLFQKYLPGAVRLVPAGRGAGGLHGVGAGGRGAGAQRDPLPLRPPAGDAAGHLGHQPDADAAGALASSARRTSASKTRSG